MIDKNKIEWLGSEFNSLPKFRRKNTHESNIASLKFIKTEVERLKDLLSDKLSSNERYEIYKMLNRSIRRAQDIYKDIYSRKIFQEFLKQLMYVQSFRQNTKRTMNIHLEMIFHIQNIEKVFGILLIKSLIL